MTRVPEWSDLRMGGRFGMIQDIWSGIISELWFQLTFLLMVALASSFLFARFKQPKVIGQIVIGIIIGPSVLGLISVSQDDPGDMVHRFAELGAIILLFMIGLECDIKEIYTRRSIIIASGGVIIPWIGGFLIAQLMLPAPNPPYDKFAQSVFIGAALVATSVAITAGVMREMKLMDTGTAKVLLGAAVVDDVLGMIVLAASTGMATNGGVEYGHLLWVALAAVAFVSLGAYVGSKFIVRLISIVNKRGMKQGIEEGGFLLALSLAFLYAVISEAIGISAIIGAFVAGTSFARCEFRESYMKRTSVLEFVFAPIFFLSLGILVDLEQISFEIWVFAGVLTLVAFLTKLIGCGLPAMLMGIGKRESLTIGVGMSPRMEIAMIIALYGLTTNVISRDIYGVIVIMGILTAVFTPTMLRRITKELPKAEEVCDVRPD